MNRTIIKDASILTPQGFQRGNLIIEDGKILEVASPRMPENSQIIQGKGRKLVPGFIDIHTHGAVQVDFNHAEAEDVVRVAEYFASQGVTAFYPAVLTDEVGVMERRLAAVARARNELGCTSVAGIHLEGPFLSPAYKGAMPEHLLQKPSYQLFCQLQEAARGLIKIVTIAPELEGAAELIRQLSQEGVRVSLGHSGASYEQAMTAIQAGAASTTHTMNGMKLLHMHDPAILTAVLESDIYCEMICDGFHLHPPIVRLLLKTKGMSRMVPVTDSIMAAGCPDGEYVLGVNPVVVQGGDAKLKTTGVRAGSTLTMKKAVDNIRQFTSLPEEEVYRLVSQNAAQLMGIFDKTGSIESGKQADLVLINQDNGIDLVFTQGQISYYADKIEEKK